LFKLIDHVVGLGGTVVTYRAGNCGSLTVRAEVTRLAGNTIGCLSSLSHDRLGLEGAGSGHGLALRAVVSGFALITSWVGLSMELRLGAEETSSAFFSDNTSTAIVTGGTFLTVLVTLVHKSTGRADGLTLLSGCADGLRNAFDGSIDGKWNGNQH